MNREDHLATVHVYTSGNTVFFHKLSENALQIALGKFQVVCAPSHFFKAVEQMKKLFEEDAE